MWMPSHEIGFEEKPKFKTNPFAMVLADRGKYIAAALTIMRVHHLAKYPGIKKLPPLVGFDDWSRVVRGALVWLGKDDPVKTLEIGRSDDPEGGERWAFVEALFKVANNKTSALTVAEMAENQSLREALSEYLDPKGNINTKAAGRWLASFQRETFGNKHLRDTPRVQGKKKWFVSEKPPPQPQCDDDGCSDFDAMEDSHG
jgi:putative DNA primase/helicase